MRKKPKKKSKKVGASTSGVNFVRGFNTRSPSYRLGVRRVTKKAKENALLAWRLKDW